MGNSPKVLIMMGSDSDLPVMTEAATRFVSWLVWRSIVERYCSARAGSASARSHRDR